MSSIIMENRRKALQAALAADSLALGLHWNYNQEALKAAFPSGIQEIIAPGIHNMMPDVIHAGKPAGSQSHYGDQLIFLLDHQIANGGRVQGWIDFWFKKVKEEPPSFYLDGATKDTLSNYEKGIKTASSSNDLGGVSRLGALLPMASSAGDLADKCAAQAGATHGDILVNPCARFFAHLVWAVLETGKSPADLIPDILASLQDAPAEFVALVNHGFSSGIAGLDDMEYQISIDPIQGSFGTMMFYKGATCPIPFSLPLCVHLIVKYGNTDAASCVEKAAVANAMLGGDTCARALLVCLVLGARPGAVVPQRWVQLLRARNSVYPLPNLPAIWHAFDSLVESMRCISLPPVDTFQIPEAALPALETMHKQFHFLHGRVMKDIESMRHAWSCLSQSALPVPDASGSSSAHHLGDANANSVSPLDSNSFKKFDRSLSAAEKRKDEVFMRQIFDCRADSNGELSSPALMDALKDIEAPVLAVKNLSAEDIFRRSDSNMSGTVDFSEFMRAAQFPDELEMVLEDDNLQNLAPAIRSCLTGGNDQVIDFADVSESALCEAVDASTGLLKRQLLHAHRKIKQAFHAKAKLQEALDKDPGKFAIRKMATGSIDDFHKGLRDRIGVPNPNFFKAMRAEHMTRSGHDFTFVTGNYNMRTQACKEWLYVVGDENGTRLDPPASDMQHGRIIRPIDDLLQNPLAKTAKLTREEMIAIVMYTGPVFVLYNAVLRQFPADIYQVFKDGDNLFPTTIFVLVSAINKLSRCMNIPPDTLLYRGLGGTLEFPDSFTRADPSCITPNALGFLEYGFMSTSADMNVALQYSGVKDGKPKAGILQIRSNAVDRGADISNFSQYPAEKEFLFVPYSFVQGEGRQRTVVVDGGGVLTVVPVRVNINLKTETVEELREKKKQLHLASARSIVDELKHELEEWATSAEATERMKQEFQKSLNEASSTLTCSMDELVAGIVNQCASVVTRHEETDVQAYVNDSTFRALVNEILDAKMWAKEAKDLWMHDKSHHAKLIAKTYTLRKSHRYWQMVLRKRINDASCKPRDKVAFSLELLKSRGLLTTGSVDEVNAEGEGLIAQAGLDGWAPMDITAASFAGADFNAIVETGDENGSALCFAAHFGHYHSISALVSARCDVNSCNLKGQTPIYLAASSGNANCINLLESLGGDVNKCSVPREISPIMIAACNGQATCIELLISLRGDVNKSDINGSSAINMAAMFGYSDCLKLLISAKGDVNKSCDDGRNPVFSAVEGGRSECLAQLISAKADVNQCYSDSSPVICAVLKQGYLKMTADSTNGMNEIGIDTISNCLAQLLSAGGVPIMDGVAMSQEDFDELQKSWACLFDRVHER